MNLLNQIMKMLHDLRIGKAKAPKPWRTHSPWQRRNPMRHGNSKNGAYYANATARRRMRNKMARKSRRINRLRAAGR